MSNISIKVEGLGKRYYIGHANEERYTAMRDVIANNVKRFGINLKRLFSENSSVSGDRIEEFWALKDVDFEINQGDTVGIIGRNGAGKSTLLKVLSRITEPTTGRIKINGRISSLLEVGTGFHPELSGSENIYLNGAILGMSRAEIKHKFDEIVDFSGVEKFLDTPVKRYSSGMYMRLAFAVAAHLESEILVVDEVLAVGDAEFRKKCLGKMNEVSKTGRTILFVSHEMNAIRELCKKAVLLHNGGILLQGECNYVINKYSQNVKTQFGERYWETDDRPGDNISKLNYCRLISSDKVACSVFANTEQIGVEVNYDIYENSSRVNICVALYSSGEQLIFMSFPEKEMIRTDKGIHSMVCWIPSHIINVDAYSIRVTAHTFYPTILHFDVMDALQFEVINSDVEDMYDYKDKMAGIIKINCNWELI
jgi:lipopolysaccharide transport system ATP-binding protein